MYKKRKGETKNDIKQQRKMYKKRKGETKNDLT